MAYRPWEAGSKLNPLLMFRDAKAITVSDTTTYDGIIAVKVTVAGNVAVVTRGGDGLTAVVIPMAVGDVLYLQVTKIMSTGTSATGIVAFW